MGAAIFFLADLIFHALQTTKICSIHVPSFIDPYAVATVGGSSALLMLSFRMLYLYLEGYRLVSGRTITMDTYVDRLLYLLYAFWETELNCLGSSAI